jgi:integrase/recombinase XerD
MLGKQARILSPAHVDALLTYAQQSRQPCRNRVLVLLSLKAGLRAAEIAKLTWDMLLDPLGGLAPYLAVRSAIAKKGSGRRIPMHPQLRAALQAWQAESGAVGAVVRSARGGPMTPVSIVNWFALAYRAIGLQGCSSHSGRRTFITCAARLVHKSGGSLRDVQLLAGHRSIQTTQAYIDGDSDAQRRLVALL